MKYEGIYWTVLAPMIKFSMKNRFGNEIVQKAIKNGKAEYRRLLAGTPELGKGNPMAANAYFAYVFVGAWPGTGKQIGLGEV